MVERLMRLLTCAVEKEKAEIKQREAKSLAYSEANQRAVANVIDKESPVPRFRIPA